MKIYNKNGHIFTKENKTAIEILEKCAMNEILVCSGETAIKILEEKKITYPKEVVSLLEQSLTAVIRIIKAGWSLNNNYYDKKILKELPRLIESQGPIQFKNHIEGTSLDRGIEEIVSYSKLSWYDEVTESVYAVVKFPKEKDTSWIFDFIKEDPELVGVSIAAAVYVTEDYEKDGKKGTRVDEWAYFDSADYVVFAAAGGQGVEVGVSEKIMHAKESMKPKIQFKKSTKEQMLEKLESIQLKVLQEKAFLEYYLPYEAYSICSNVTNALWNCMYDVMMDVSNSEIIPEEAITKVEEYFNKALDMMKTIDFSSLIPNSQKTNKEQISMDLKELQEKYAELYASIVKDAKESAVKDVTAKMNEIIDKLTKEKETFIIENISLKKVLDEVKLKEMIAAKKEAIAKAVADSGLAKEYVTDTFVKLLEDQEDQEDIKQLLDDRKKLVEDASKKATTHLEGDNTLEIKSTEIDKALVTSAFESILR